MNVKETLTALEPLEGHHILIVINAKPHGFVHGQPCIRVDHLPPDQRQTEDQGNIILWDGFFTLDGAQAGSTFWAKDVHHITWTHDTIAHIHHSHDVTRVMSIIKLWKLGDQK